MPLVSQKKNHNNLPAGPDNIALEPLKESIGVSPPSDCINVTFTLLKCPENPEANPFKYL